MPRSRSHSRSRSRSRTRSRSRSRERARYNRLQRDREQERDRGEKNKEKSKSRSRSHSRSRSRSRSRDKKREDGVDVNSATTGAVHGTRKSSGGGGASASANASGIGMGGGSGSGSGGSLLNAGTNKNVIAQRSEDILRSHSVMREVSVARSMGSQTLGNTANVTVGIGGTLAVKSGAKVKVKFMSREEREEHALAALQEKRKEEKKRSWEASHMRDEFFHFARDVRGHERRTDRNRGGGGGGNDARGGASGNPNEEDNNANNGANGRNNKTRQERDKEREDDKKQNAKEEELQLIKEQYLGQKKSKKSMVPPSQKFKFNFDWEPEEDTTEGLNELYAKPADVALAFGRGYVAGVDRDSQKQKNKSLYEDITKDRSVKIHHHNDDDMAVMLKQKQKQREDKLKQKRELDRQEARNWRDKSLEEMTERDWRILKEEFRISTKFGGRLPNPVRFWSESGLPEKLIRAIAEVAKYEEPSPIQRMAIPVGLQNRDCVGIAETGSGKTAAFVLPMLTYIMKQPPMTREIADDGPYAIVLAPARELAKQIEIECKKFATYLKYTVVTMIGGIDIDQQSYLLREGAEIIIATPGRLIDAIERRYVVLNQCNYVVLDEADRMIDMGFEPQVKAIFEKMPATNLRPLDESEEDKNRIYRQTFMFSATMPPAVERLTREYLRNPVYITIGDPNATASERVKQQVLWVQESMKRKHLDEMMEEIEPPIMIFCNMKKTADMLAKYLRTQEWSAISLHGGKSQEVREDALDRFRKKEVDILVCTNVAGRGIDVEGVQHVINYDLPNNIQDYTHRIGRTGRAGAEGVATSFLTKDDTDIMFHLKQMLLKTNNPVPPELMNHEAAMRDPTKPYDEPKKGKLRLPNL